MALSTEQLEEIKNLISTAAHGSNGAPAPAGVWNPTPQPVASFAAPAGAPAPRAVLVPIKLQAPNGGSVRVYLEFPPELATSPQSLMAALGALAASGLPLDVYTPKNAWGNRGGNGWNRSGGW